MIRHISLIVTVLLLGSAGNASGQFFSESFDGGFDNVGWGIGGFEDTFAFTETGLHFDLRGFRNLDFQQIQVARRLNINDSFRVSLQVSDLELIAKPGLDLSAQGRVSVFLEMRNAPRPSFLSFSVFKSEHAPNPNTFSFTSNTSENLITVEVAPGENVGIEVVLQDGIATYFYDHDTTDGLAAVELFTSEYVGHITDEATVWISAAGSGVGGSALGEFDQFTVMPLSDILGDFNGLNGLDVGDVDLLIGAMERGDLGFDLTGDREVDVRDLTFWVEELKRTYLGDANLDGEFGSTDLVLVFGAGEYEDALTGNSTWGTGDWNGDGDFTTSDLVAAFQAGGYELGPRPAAVPEPRGLLGLWFFLPVLRVKVLLSLRQ